MGEGWVGDHHVRGSLRPTANHIPANCLIANCKLKQGTRLKPDPLYNMVKKLEKGLLVSHALFLDTGAFAAQFAQVE